MLPIVLDAAGETSPVVALTVAISLALGVSIAWGISRIDTKAEA